MATLERQVWEEERLLAKESSELPEGCEPSQRLEILIGGYLASIHLELRENATTSRIHDAILKYGDDKIQYAVEDQFADIRLAFQRNASDEQRCAGLKMAASLGKLGLPTAQIQIRLLTPR